jgi:hypothetical protein
LILPNLTLTVFWQTILLLKEKWLLMDLQRFLAELSQLLT